MCGLLVTHAGHLDYLNLYESQTNEKRVKGEDK